jgi:hypothetical protein
MQLARAVQQHPVRRAYIPVEMELSWWVPVIRESDGKLYLGAFFYATVIRHGAPKQVRRPRFQIVVDPEDGRLVALTDCDYQDFAAVVPTGDVVGELRLEDLPARTIPELEQLRDELSQAYDRILGLAFKPTEQLTPTECETVAQFKKRFEHAVEPFMMPFYHALNPAFFEWLSGVC